MHDYRLKIERAKAHIGVLTEEISAFKARETHGVTIEIDPKTGDKVFRLKVLEPIPVNWSCIVGDAIHNIRSSLDYLACAIVRRSSPDRSLRHVHFVIRETKEKFEADLPENIRGASAESISLIQGLKPYMDQDGDKALVRLHRLDILDKHQAIVPVWSTYKAFNLGGVGQAIMQANWKAAGFPERAEPIPKMNVWIKNHDRSPVYDGTELLRVQPAAQTPADDKHEFMFEIAFGQGQVIDGEPIVSALTHLADHVAGIFTVFETANAV